MELVYFWKTHCETSAKATPVIEQVAATLKLKLTSLDARSPQAGALIMRLGILEIPSLAIVHRNKKLAVLDEPQVFTVKKLTAYLERIRVDA